MMKILKRVFGFYINSSLHVAFAVLALFSITVLEYRLTEHRQLSAFVFLGAISGYNFVKYAKVAGLNHRSLTSSLKTIQILSGVCFVLLILIAFRLSVTTILITAAFGLATFFYAVPFRHRSLRKLSGIKIFVVAFVWSGITVILPFIASETLVSGDVLLTFFQRILIVVALILPFEIRDVPYDALNLKTLPQQFGIRNTKLLGLLVLVVSLILEFFKESAEVAYIISLIFFCVILGWMLIISKTEQKRHFASFWVEGLPILWLILYVLIKQF